jgi:hypothetical protein
MPYLLPCDCGHRLPVKKSQAGSFVACQGCGRQLDVPTMAGLGKLDWIDDETTQPGSKNASKRHWSLVRGILAATCFVVAILGLGRSGMYGIYRYNHPTNFTVEDWMKLLDEETQALSPAETWDSWCAIHESGLGAKKPPELFVQKRFLEQMDTTMGRWAIAGGIGLVGLLAASWWPFKK